MFEFKFMFEFICLVVFKFKNLFFLPFPHTSVLAPLRFSAQLAAQPLAALRRSPPHQRQPSAGPHLASPLPRSLTGGPHLSSPTSASDSRPSPSRPAFSAGPYA
jgi:hypothetical protein